MKNKFTCLLIDDEEPCLISLQKLIEMYCPELQILATITSVSAAVKAISEQKPDLIFLDVQMPGGTGFDLLDQLQELSIETVFVTAHEEYALRAIKYSALEYLLKPVNPDDLRTVVSKLGNKNMQILATQYQMLRESMADEWRNERIVLSTLDAFIVVKIEDILYCMADGNYTRFYTQDNKNFIVSRKLGEYEEMLKDKPFMRVHKSYLVNLHKIEKVLKTEGSSVVLSNGDQIPISVRKREEIYALMKDAD